MKTNINSNNHFPYRTQQMEVKVMDDTVWTRDETTARAHTLMHTDWYESLNRIVNILNRDKNE